MDLKELLDLIAIRGYVVNSVANPIFGKSTVKELDGLLILLDKKIAAILLSDEFKEYVGFGDLKDAIKQMKADTNQPWNDARAIMSGLVKKKQ